MAECPAELPDEIVLDAGIESILNELNAAGGRIEILERVPNLSRSTVPCIKYICRDELGTVYRLFCKFGQVDESPGPNHRLGIAYEANVYAHVLKHSRSQLPRYYGTFTDPVTRVICLVLGCVEDVSPLIFTNDPPATLRLASEWLASFHAEQEIDAHNRYSPYLALYDADYYLGWSMRVAEFSRPLFEQYPWLPTLCKRASESFKHLLEAPLTVIHGECYATNWLVNESKVISIDWESAALAAGAIDVASVAWGWGEEALRDCRKSYENTRWPNGPPAVFDKQITAARLYLALRWLGDCAEWTTAPDPPVSFEELYQIGKEAELV